MQIDDNTEDEERSFFPIRQSFEPVSNVIAERQVQPEKQRSPSSSTAKGTQIRDSEAQL
jgi:hypothetical protein